MAFTNGIIFALASICLVLLSCQTSETEAVYSCQNATAATVNGTKLLGTWYEAARKPVGGGSNTESCVEMIITYNNGNVSAQLTYSLNPDALWINQTVTNNVSVSTAPTSDTFPAIFTISVNGVNTTLKILETDYDSYAYICGFVGSDESPATTEAPSTTTASSSSTSPSSSSSSSSSTEASTSTTSAPSNNQSPAGAFILTRERFINSSVLNDLIVNATKNYTDFQGISNVTQSVACYEYNGAGTAVPVMALIMALVYSVLKLVN